MEYLSDLLWGKVLVLILVTLGLVFTVVSRFVQFRYFGRMFGILKEAFQHQEGHPMSVNGAGRSSALR